MSPRRPIYALLLALAAGTLGCDQTFQAPANQATPARAGSESAPEPATQSRAEQRQAFDQQAADTHQKWQDVQNAGTEQEKIDAANAALAAQQALADQANAPAGGSGQ